MQRTDPRTPACGAPRFRPDRVTMLVAALAILGAALILTRQVNYGVGVSTDSLAYLTDAEYIAAGDSPPLSNSPPLFSAMLALAALLGFDPIGAGAWINAAAFGMTVFLCGVWLRRKTQSAFAVIWASAALAAAPPLIHITPWVLPEPLFVLLATSALFSLDAFIETRRRRVLALAAVLASLAFLTRYQGVALIGTGVILLLFQRNAPFVHRAKESVVYAAVAGAPACAWLLRNLLLHGFLTNHSRYQPLYSLSQNIESAAAEFWKMLFAWSDFAPAAGRRIYAYADGAIVPALVGAALLAALAAAAAAARRRAKPPQEPGHSRSIEPAMGMALFVGAYTTTTIIGVTTSSWSEGFGLRHFAPAYPALILSVALAANACFRAAPRKHGVLVLNVSPLAALGAAALSLWLLPQVSLYAEQYRLHLNGPLGHDARTWRASPTVQDLRAKALDGRAVVGVNSSEVAPYLTGVPDGFVWLPCSTPDEVKAKVARADERGEEFYVVWLNGFTNAPGCGMLPSVMRSVVRVETLARLPDGNVFRLSPADGDPLDAYRSAYAYAASAEPVIASVFDVHLSGGALTYLKEECASSDAQDKFFLHVVPVNESDLPYDRRRHGFDNLDFAFDIHGARFDGKCLTTAVLPDYPAARVRTGQFVRGEGRSWEGEFSPG